MTGLNDWLEQATRQLSKDSSAQVRTEIQAHYESAREASMMSGASAEQAERLAIEALGDAKMANRQYRRVLLTSAEARMLRDGNREARAVCSRAWLQRLLLSISAIAIGMAIVLMLQGAMMEAMPFMGMGLLLASPFMPIYSQSRARFFRCIKWVVLICTFGFLFGPDALKWSWLLFSCLWPLVWVERMRVSLRRKLPVAKWPKHLYL